MTPRAPAPRRPVQLPSLVIGTILVATAGCSLLFPPAVPHTKFYVLTAVSQAGDIPAGRRLAFGLGPINLPTYLDRPEMVSRVAANQLSYDEFDRWSEPLKNNFVNVLATDLDALVGFERLAIYPWYSNTPLDYSASVVVLRFEPQPGGQAVLDARWAIGNGRGQIYANRESHLTRPAGSPAETAAALSDMVGALAREIAVALRETDASVSGHRAPP